MSNQNEQTHAMMRAQREAQRLATMAEAQRLADLRALAQQAARQSK